MFCRELCGEVKKSKKFPENCVFTSSRIVNGIMTSIMDPNSHLSSDFLLGAFCFRHETFVQVVRES